MGARRLVEIETDLATIPALPLMVPGEHGR
jgi:hypothetical protein